MKLFGLRLRNAVLLFLFLLFLASLEKILVSQSVSEIEEIPKNISSECKLGLRLLQGDLIGSIDSLRAFEHRVYFRAKMDLKVTKPSVLWYREGVLQKKRKCKELCISYLPPKVLKAGRWTVDYIADQHLLCTIPFRILPKE